MEICWETKAEKVEKIGFKIFIKYSSHTSNLRYYIYNTRREIGVR